MAARTPVAINVLLVVGLTSSAQAESLRDPLDPMSVAGASGKVVGVLQLPLNEPRLPSVTLSHLSLPPDLIEVGGSTPLRLDLIPVALGGMAKPG